MDRVVVGVFRGLPEDFSEPGEDVFLIYSKSNQIDDQRPKSKE